MCENRNYNAKYGCDKTNSSIVNVANTIKTSMFDSLHRNTALPIFQTKYGTVQQQHYHNHNHNPQTAVSEQLIAFSNLNLSTYAAIFFARHRRLHCLHMQAVIRSRLKILQRAVTPFLPLNQ